MNANRSRDHGIQEICITSEHHARALEAAAIYYETASQRRDLDMERRRTARGTALALKVILGSPGMRSYVAFIQSKIKHAASPPLREDEIAVVTREVLWLTSQDSARKAIKTAAEKGVKNKPPTR